MIKLQDGIAKRIAESTQLQCFANSAAGSYDYLSQVILLNSVQRSDIEAILADPEERSLDSFNAKRKIFPLLSHEQAHWVDHTSTLWGFEFLEKCFESISISIKGQRGEVPETQFYRKKLFYDELVKIRFPSYYSTNNASNSSRPWKYTYSMGQLFDLMGRVSGYPIFFTRFEDREGGHISREPFTLCSLLEVSAVWQEVAVESSILSSELSGDEQIIEHNQFKRRVFDLLYNPCLTEYSVAVHKLSNSLHMADAIEAYRVSAVLARFCLNSTDRVFLSIKPEDVYGGDHKFLEGIKIALKNNDRAVLYYVLCDVLAEINKDTPVEAKNLNVMLTELFRKYGVDLESVWDEADSLLQEISVRVAKTCEDEYYVDLLRSGVLRYRALRNIEDKIYPYNELRAPGAILGDDYYFSPYEVNDPGVQDRWLTSAVFFDDLREFSSACVSLP